MQAPPTVLAPCPSGEDLYNSPFMNYSRQLAVALHMSGKVPEPRRLEVAGPFAHRAPALRAPPPSLAGALSSVMTHRSY